MNQTKGHPFKESEEVFRDTILSRLDTRDRLIQTVFAELEARGFSPHPFFDRLILDELITNAIVHGNQKDPSRVIDVRLFCQGRLWGVEITDQGAGFDWRLHLEKIKRPIDPYMTSGRGISLLLLLGAEIFFFDGGRRVVVVRKPKLNLKSCE